MSDISKVTRPDIFAKKEAEPTSEQKLPPAQNNSFASEQVIVNAIFDLWQQAAATEKVRKR